MFSRPIPLRRSPAVRQFGMQPATAALIAERCVFPIEVPR